MLICHKLVASNEATVLQACHMSDVYATSAVYIMLLASWEVVCRWAPHPVLSITSGLSNTITLQRRITTTAVARGSCCTQKNCMHAEQIIIMYHIYIYIFALCIWYCFQLCYTRTIVTVYTDNILFTLSLVGTGEGGWFVIFRLFKSILIFVNWI